MLSGPVLRTALGLETGPDQDQTCQDRGPGPSDFLDERLEKTAVLGPVRTGLEPNRDGSNVAYIFKFWYFFHPNWIKTGQDIKKMVKTTKVAHQIFEFHKI